MRLRLTDMTVGLAFGITAAVVTAFAAGATLYSRHHVDELLDRDRATALAQGELMRAALEHQMIEDDRTLIGELVQTFAREPRVRQVMLLDRSGRVQFSSGPAVSDEALNIDGPTCQACHQYPPAQRGTSRVIATGDGAVLRTVIPFRNREACHSCHDPSHRINGIMLFDVDAETTRAAMSADMRRLVGGSSLLAFALIAVIAVIVRVVVMRRLQRFETTARLIAEGDLARRVPAGGADTIAWLANEFNAMADSMSTLIADVRRERERLEVVINSIDDGIVVLDAERRVVAANDAFLRRTGTSRGDTLGRSCLDTAPAACSECECPALSCLAHGQASVRVLERKTADGRIAWEEIHASPVAGPSGRPVQVVEVWRDITERRAGEARLAESHRLASLGMLASGFSHELNTPLATVLACVEGILRDARRAAGESSVWQHVTETAGIARDQILRCRSVTQHFLRLSRGERASADVIALEPVVAAVARLVAPTLRERQVTLDIAPVPADAHIRANEAELQQALINLLLNAAQACTQGGRVTLTVIGGDPVHIKVADNGCGIAASDQKRIFEPFFSLRAGGTGLGLFMTKSFVGRCGGEIGLSSTPGAGSEFDLALPAADQNRPMEYAS